MKSIRTTVVDIPIVNTPRTIATNFSVDFDAMYTLSIRLAPDTTREKAVCLLGGAHSDLYPEVDCKNSPAPVAFAWQLKRDGKAAGTGTSAEMGSSSTSSGALAVTIVSFDARRNHQYTIALTFNNDTSKLPGPPPRARVELDIFNREDLIWAGAFYDVVALGFCLLGTLMIAVPIARARFRRKSSSNAA